jgi:cell division septum initiation protein DivIVA
MPLTPKEVYDLYGYNNEGKLFEESEVRELKQELETNKTIVKLRRRDANILETEINELNSSVEFLKKDAIQCDESNKKLLKKNKELKQDLKDYKNMLNSRGKDVVRLEKEKESLKKLLRAAYEETKDIVERLGVTADEDLLKSIEDGLSR